MIINNKREETFLKLIQNNFFTFFDDGRIMRNSTKRFYTQKQKGYIIVDVYGIGAIRAHRLIWIHHHGLIPPNMVINHINGIKDDNRIENLELVSQKENMQHAFKTRLCVNVKNKPTSLFVKYSEQILELRLKGVKIKDIMKKLNLSKDIVKRSIRYLKDQNKL